MTFLEAAATTKKKRGQGRPVSGENDVGRERLLVATEKLLTQMAPARVTITRVAQEAKVDPALVRYYFGNRTALLIAVADRVTEHNLRGLQREEDPEPALAAQIARAFQLVRGAPFMHRLMVDELADAGTDESRARVRSMNLDLVEFYRELLAADDGDKLVRADPLFVHLTILGACDFFSSAQPLIRGLVSDNTDMDDLAVRFQKFLVDALMNGLRNRKQDSGD